MKNQLFAGAVFARDQHARFARRDLVDQQADMFDLGRGADAVSYTHLDVYKRQS